MNLERTWNAIAPMAAGAGIGHAVVTPFSITSVPVYLFGTLMLIVLVAGMWHDRPRCLRRTQQGERNG